MAKPLKPIPGRRRQKVAKERQHWRQVLSESAREANELNDRTERASQAALDAIKRGLLPRPANLPLRPVLPARPEIGEQLIADVVRDALSAKKRPSQHDVRCRVLIAANMFRAGLEQLSRGGEPSALPLAPSK